MTEIAIGSYAPDFEIPGVDGKVHHLARYLNQFRAVGVIIMANQCPYVRLHLERLRQLQAEFAGQGFTLVGINANDDSQSPDDSFEQMKIFAAEQRLNFPYLRDVTQEVARGFGAEYTPQAFLIDQAGILRYGGAIDDNPQDADTSKYFYLRNAVAQLLSGNEIVTTLTSPVGCLVKWRSA